MLPVLKELLVGGGNLTVPFLPWLTENGYINLMLVGLGQMDLL